MVTVTDIIARLAVSIAMGAVFLAVLWVGSGKELKRMEEVRKWNCVHYGEFINKQEGRDVCPPTPHG